MSFVPPPQQPPSFGAPHGPYGQPVAPYPSSQNATIALVMGILGIVLCPALCSGLALYYAAEAEREIARNPGMDGAGNAKTGKILGIVGLVFFGLVVAFYAVVIAVGLTAELESA